MNGYVNRYPEQIRGLIAPNNLSWLTDIREHGCFLQADDRFFSESCYESKKPLIVIWGDSFAASIYPGLKAQQSKMQFGLSQLTTAACPPIFNLEELKFSKNCNYINQEVFDYVVRVKPRVIILSAEWVNKDYPLTNLELREKAYKTLQLLKRALPESSIIMLGTFPIWVDGGPLVKIIETWKKQGDKTAPIPVYLEADTLSTANNVLKDAAVKAGIEFIAPTSILCDQSKCISRTGDSAEELIAIDFGHLSKKGSEYFASQIWDKILPMLR
jgi:hypothetical protein